MIIIVMMMMMMMMIIKNKNTKSYGNSPQILGDTEYEASEEVSALQKLCLGAEEDVIMEVERMLLSCCIQFEMMQSYTPICPSCLPFRRPPRCEYCGWYTL
jgi:hypothetical protein